VRRDDVRDAVQQLRDVPGQVGVPGVAVHEVRAGARGRHLQVDAQHLKRGVRRLQATGNPIAGYARLAPLGAEGVHPDVTESAQLPGEVLHMHARPSVHLWRVLTAEQINAHGQ
jgi:hypothetical protein